MQVSLFLIPMPKTYHGHGLRDCVPLSIRKNIVASVIEKSFKVRDGVKCMIVVAYYYIALERKVKRKLKRAYFMFLSYCNYLNRIRSVRMKPSPLMPQAACHNIRVPIRST